MDIKGGSSAAIRGGSGENADFLNAPDGPVGEVEDFEAAFNSEPVAPSETGEPIGAPVDDGPEMEALEERAEATEPNSNSQEESSPVEQEVQEFRDILGAHAKRNEDDIDRRVAAEFNRDLEKYGDDPAMMASVAAGESRAYVEAVFNRRRGEGLSGTGEAVA